MSHLINMALFPLAWIILFGFCLARTNTREFCFKKDLVISTPIPFVPPVTTIDLFLNLSFLVFSRFNHFYYRVCMFDLC